MKRLKRLFKLIFLASISLSSTSCIGLNIGSLHTSHIHNLKFIERREPTCTGEGQIAHYYCMGCDKSFLDSEGKTSLTFDQMLIEKIDHKFEKIDRKEPTCDKTGVIEHYKCKYCKILFVEGDESPLYWRNVDIQPLGHDLEFIAEVQSTCTTPGHNKYYHCKRCEKLFSKEGDEIKKPTEYPLKEHQYDEYGLCYYSDCDSQQSNYYDFLVGGKQSFQITDDFGLKFYTDHQVLTNQYFTFEITFHNKNNGLYETPSFKLFSQYDDEVTDLSRVIIHDGKHGFMIKNLANENNFDSFTVSIKCIREHHLFDDDGVCIDCGYHYDGPVFNFNLFNDDDKFFSYTCEKGNARTFAIKFSDTHSSSIDPHYITFRQVKWLDDGKYEDYSNPYASYFGTTESFKPPLSSNNSRAYCIQNVIPGNTLYFTIVSTKSYESPKTFQFRFGKSTTTIY